jgi:membrane protease subunit (stomatin/prohibitin family)
MALIDVVKWNAPAGELCWKFPSAELSTKTQLIVHESQVAVFFKGGRRYDVLGAGTHTLDSNNLPILGGLINLPFGGNSPFSAEVWFVSLSTPLDLKWQTSTPLQLEDPSSGVVVPVTISGQAGLRVREPAVLLQKLVGTLSSFRVEHVLNLFDGELQARIKSSVAQAVVHRQIGILQIETQLVELSEAVEATLTPTFSTFGLDFGLFRISSISVPEGDPSFETLKRAKAEAARRRIEGISIHQERTFDVMEAGANNVGLGGLFAAGGMGGMMSPATSMRATSPASVPSPPGGFTPPPRPQPASAPPPPFGATPTHQYYAQVNGAQRGPVTFDQVRQAVKAGAVVATTPMWREGLPDWVTAQQVAELAQFFAAAGPTPFGGGAASGPPPFKG